MARCRAAMVGASSAYGPWCITWTTSPSSYTSSLSRSADGEEREPEVGERVGFGEQSVGTFAGDTGRALDRRGIATDVRAVPRQHLGLLWVLAAVAE